ncbi:MAG: hypothetical protein AAFQ53_00270 [Bacteroidota bacterium]
MSVALAARVRPAGGYSSFSLLAVQLMERARSILAPVVAVVVGALVVAAIEAAGHKAFPPPADIDVADRDALARVIENAPFGALVFVLIAWFCGTAAAVFTAIRVHPDRARWAAYVAAALLAAGAVVTIVTIPHPTWFVIATPFVYALALGAGLRMAE